MQQWNIMEQCELMSRAQYAKALNNVTVRQRYNALCASIMANAADAWEASSKQKEEQKRACYFSAEFLMGRAIYNNLFALGKLDEVKQQWKDAGFDPTEWEMEEDAALGNGGLGRLAACFLDSAATHDLPLDGYGIHYRFGLFKQCIVDGCQSEEPDDWTKWGDPWCVRREEDAVVVKFAEQTMKAVPYDMPVIGYGGKTINTLRLWQSEPMNAIDLGAFNDQNYFKSSQEYDEAICISQILYPNDTMKAGKQLRLKQEYFFTSASLQDILKKFKEKHGSYERLPELLAVQLNDTHPILAIPELLRLLTEDGVEWETALAMAKEIFSYTNHTVMAEAMERWSVELMQSVVPHIFPIIERLNDELKAELKEKNVPEEQWNQYLLIHEDAVHMARLGSYISKKINGVAQIHSEILRKDTLKQWEALYPGKILNETNGITPRRWLGLCNPQLSALISEKLGSSDWLYDLDKLAELRGLVNDDETIARFVEIKKEKKRELSAFLAKKEGVDVDPSWMFDIQVKRFHEYKRQTMNALAALLIYLRLKDGKLPNFRPMMILFGGKSAAGYARAKGTIKLIHEIAKLINNDPDTKDKLRIVFATDYNVSYAEKLIPAADLSEQISTAGTEASGTSNMKFMANGAVTIGTMDGANIEIVEQAGMENNYIFGMSEEEVNAAIPGYDPKILCAEQPELERVLNVLIDGTLEDKDDLLKQLHQSLLEPTYNRADHYMVLLDLLPYVEAKLQANADSQDELYFGRKCWMNMASCGKFSSDRTIKGYADEIWKIRSIW